jgi:ubiquinone/menaquinone biosynthesis C-methylase UbiE
MTDDVVRHYTQGRDLVMAIQVGLRRAGKEIGSVSSSDLAGIDQFHIRGKRATLELAGRMNLDRNSRVLDVGCGLGGPARTVAEEYGCRVVGVDLVEDVCRAATVLSDWVGLGEQVEFRSADGAGLPFGDEEFDSAMSIHAAMNIEAKDRMYAEIRRVIKPGGIFAVYDVLQGEGGDVLFPVPWARDGSISHLATPDEMVALLNRAGFSVLNANDSTDESEAWFERMASRMAHGNPPPVTFEVILGDDFSRMAENQVRNLRERRIRTVSYTCRK